MQDVKSFFYKYYRPNNAILAVSGHVSIEQVKDLSEKWFGPIPSGQDIVRSSPVEPEQTELRRLKHKSNVPFDSIYLGFHMSGRPHKDYHVYDLISDILGKGKSSRLYQQLVKNKQLFTSINAYITGSIDPGLLVIGGKLNKDIDIETGENAIFEELEVLITEKPSDMELKKVKNQAESTLAFSEVEILNKAMSLAYYAQIGDVTLVNKEISSIRSVSTEDISRVSKLAFRKENTSILHYLADNNG